VTTVVVGGTRGIGHAVAWRRAAAGDDVVLTGRDQERADQVAATLAEAGEGTVRGVALDLAEPDAIAAALAGVESVDRLVLAAIDRDSNSVRDYDVAAAVRLTTLKLVGYTEVVHALVPALHEESSIVVFGGRAKDRPYAGSTTVSTVNGGVVGLVAALALELAPVRVNGLHPGIVGDSPFWAGKPPEVLEAYASRTPTWRLATVADVVDSCEFLLHNRSVNAIQLYVDGGWLVT
jgi:NAD(P)-dependent dehydrogenase (short-subunit alcohol dehydrogenase family)